MGFCMSMAATVRPAEAAASLDDSDLYKTKMRDRGVAEDPRTDMGVHIAMTAA
jgi:hypothetical protein